MILRDFNETFAYELRDPEFAAGYLQACLEYEDVNTFLIALREVMKTNGPTELMEETSLGRESLYKMLSAQGNLKFRALEAILSALGMRFSVVRAEAAEAPQEAEASQEAEAPRAALQAA